MNYIEALQILASTCRPLQLQPGLPHASHDVAAPAATAQVPRVRAKPISLHCPALSHSIRSRSRCINLSAPSQAPSHCRRTNKKALMQGCTALRLECCSEQVHGYPVQTWVAYLHCNVAQTVISPICTCAGLEGDTTAVRLYELTSRLCTWCRSANHPTVDTAAQ